MMKKMKFMIPMLLIGYLLVSCASSSSSSSTTTTTTTSKPRFELLEHQGSAFGRDFPQWVDVYSSTFSLTEVDKLYPGKKAFIQEASGENLEFLKRQASTTGVNAQVAQLARTAVIMNVEEVASGVDKDYNLDAFRATVNTSSAANFRGLVREGDYWLYVKTAAGVEEYRYYVIYLMDIKLLDQQFQLLMDEGVKALDDPELRSTIQKGNASALELINSTAELTY